MDFASLFGLGDFSLGNNGLPIRTQDIKRNSLSNKRLSGFKFECNNGKELCPIDPSTVNLEGTDFSGSKGAIVTLENVDTLPSNCNLTDVKIIVNSKEDIIKFNLQKYGDNVYVKQNSVINGKIINVDINDYLNFTGTIDERYFRGIRESLKLECENDEQIRTETNKIIADFVTQELRYSFDFDVLYDYFDLFRKIMEQIQNKEIGSEKLSDSFDNKPLPKEVIDLLANVIVKQLGNPVHDWIRIEKVDSKIRLYTEDGVFTIDLLRLNMSDENSETFVLDDEEISIPISAIEATKEIFGSIYRRVREEEEKEEAEEKENSSSTFTIDSLFSNLFSGYSKTENFRDCFSEVIQTSIYDSLEVNNNGYECDLKPIHK